MFNDKMVPKRGILYMYGTPYSATTSVVLYGTYESKAALSILEYLQSRERERGKRGYTPLKVTVYCRVAPMYLYS